MYVLQDVLRVGRLGVVVLYVPDTFVIYSMICTSSCNYSLCTPDDDGCGRHLNHVE